MHNVGECRTCVDHKRHPSGGDTLPYFAVDFGWKVLTEQPAVMRELPIRPDVPIKGLAAPQAPGKDRRRGFQPVPSLTSRGVLLKSNDSIVLITGKCAAAIRARTPFS